MSNVVALQGEHLQRTFLLKEAKRTVILVTHKTNVLSATDFIVVMQAGQIQTAGPRDQVLAAVLNQQNPAARPKVQAVPA